MVDAVGGGLAALAAGVAQSLGREAVAATTGAPAALPEEVTAALQEVGMKVPSVVPLGDGADGDVVFVGDAAPRGLSVAAAWKATLYRPPAVPHAGLVPGDDSIERLSAARIARDRFERRLEQAR